MLKRALFLINNEQEMISIQNFSKSFKEKYNVVLDGLYVEDILRYEVFPATIEGVNIDISTTYAIQKWESIENEKVKTIKKDLDNVFDNLYILEGETTEIALEMLKKYDLLVLTKNEKIGPFLRELLRTHYKPIIVVTEQEEYKFDNIMLLDDGGYKSNRSFSSYENLFGFDTIDVLRVNVEEKDILKDIYKDKYNLLDKKGDPLDIILDESKKHDLIIMGDLKYAVMLEKITGKLGVKILEKIQKPIFIG